MGLELEFKNRQRRIGWGRGSWESCILPLFVFVRCSSCRPAGHLASFVRQHAPTSGWRDAARLAEHQACTLPICRLATAAQLCSHANDGQQQLAQLACSEACSACSACFTSSSRLAPANVSNWRSRYVLAACTRGNGWGVDACEQHGFTKGHQTANGALRLALQVRLGCLQGVISERAVQLQAGRRAACRAVGSGAERNTSSCKPLHSNRAVRNMNTIAEAHLGARAHGEGLVIVVVAAGAVVEHVGACREGVGGARLL